MSQLLNFLRGIDVDPRGRSIADIIKQDDAFLEREHSYIQWLFPLREYSHNIHDAPVIDDAEIAVAKSDERVVKNMQRSVKRMTQFYTNTDHWLQHNDHNHLRITRILKSTAMLVGDDCALGFYDLIMERVCVERAVVAPKNITYWTDAVRLSY